MLPIAYAPCMLLTCKGDHVPSGNFTLAWGGSACDGDALEPGNATFIVMNLTTPNCTARSAAQRTTRVASHTNIVLVAHPDRPPPRIWDPLNDMQLSRTVVVISADDGAALYRLMAEAAGGASRMNINNTLLRATGVVTSGSGDMGAIVASGNLVDASLGMHASLWAVARLGSNLFYRALLENTLAASPGLVVTVLDGAELGGTARVTLPPRSVTRVFPWLTVDAELSCQTAWRSSCLLWDRMFSVYLDCGAGPFEVSRVINGFQAGGR